MNANLKVKQTEIEAVAPSPAGRPVDLSVTYLHNSQAKNGTTNTKLP
jgi:hypothetical protein